MLGESPDRDIYWEMKRKEVHIHESVDMWKSKPERRSLILNWLADICEDFTWATCTRYIAFTLFDRFMSLSPMPSIEELQVLACACVSLAGKAEETNLVRNSDMADIGQTTPKLLMDAEFRVLDVRVISFLNSNILRLLSGNMCCCRLQKRSWLILW